MTHATLTTHPVQATQKPTGKIVLAVLVTLLVLLNVVYFAFLRQSGSTIEVSQAVPGGRVIQAIPISDHQVVALTADNRFVLVEDGKNVREKKLNSNITVLDTSADKSKIYGGTSDSNVITWDNQLNEKNRFKVNGRVVGLQVDGEGKLVIGYGIGKFTGRFWVGRFDETGKADYKKQVGIDVSTVTAIGNKAYFGTVEGKLGALGPDGKELWRVTAKHPILLLDSTKDGRLVAADERGGVSMFNPEKGQLLWRQQLSDYPMRMLSYDRISDKVMAGDDDGKLFMLNMNGQPFYQTAASNSALRNFIHPNEETLAIVTGRGEWVKVNLGLALGSQRQSTIDLLVLLGNIALALGAIGTVIAMTPRLRTPTLRAMRQIKASRTAYMLIFPSMLLIVVFSYVPTVMGLYYSFTNFNLSEPIRFTGLQNFTKIAKDNFFWTGVGNMMLILVTSLIKEFTIPLLVAELIFWLRWMRVKYWLRVAFIIPSIVPGVVGILLWKQIYDPQIGLINEILKAVGLGYLARGWLSDAGTAIWAIIFAGFPWVSIFAFLIYFGGLLNINREIFDAAAIDGASAWKRFINIDLQMIRPQLRLILFFTFLGAVQGYGGIWIMTRGGPGTATYVPGLQMFLQIAAAEFGYASAIGLVLALAILAVTLWRFRFNQTPDAA
jgi:ABC-type sugar transport system permease subunit/outer membrane protein assembly factor BamB